MQRLKEEVRKKILIAGANLFKSKGFKETSMKDIANDAGISTGNIYRYFLTKHHLLNEIQLEIENEFDKFFRKIPSSYNELDHRKMFNVLKEEIIKMAKERGNDLDIMFKCADQGLFTDFKDKILNMFTEKISEIMKSINNKKADISLCGAIARSFFEGFYYIVKENVQNVEKLKENLEIYDSLMSINLDKKVMGVEK